MFGLIRMLTETEEACSATQPHLLPPSTARRTKAAGSKAGCCKTTRRVPLLFDRCLAADTSQLHCVLTEKKPNKLSKSFLHFSPVFTGNDHRASPSVFAGEPQCNSAASFDNWRKVWRVAWL